MTNRIYDKDNYYEKMCSLMDVLREECPWDRAQTLPSLRRYTLEEVHEVIEAVELAERGDDWQPLKQELGDLLIQILFYARLASEAGQFDFGDVIDALIDKMIYRHPHVFGDAAPADLHQQWDQLKDAEQQRDSLMDDIPPLPALKYAQKQQQRAARVGFDWARATDVLAKIREELEEFEQEVRQQNGVERIEDEFGDLLFTLTNLARKLDLDAELCLMQTNRKFAARFRLMEQLAERQGTPLSELSEAQLENLYAQAKSSLNPMPSSPSDHQKQPR